MMKILAHRGYWLHKDEQNTIAAFLRAFENGFGIETDFRDFNGALVISHEIPHENCINVSEFIFSCKKYLPEASIALNIKANGLQTLVKDFIGEACPLHYFVFDMSVPDTRGYLAEKITVFTRLSDYENTPIFLDQSVGVWVDAFESEWYNATLIHDFLNNRKEVAIVSPELHRRPHMKLWNFLKENNFHQNDLVLLCTDYPQEAKDYFNV